MWISLPCSSKNPKLIIPKMSELQNQILIQNRKTMITSHFWFRSDGSGKKQSERPLLLWEMYPASVMNHYVCKYCSIKKHTPLNTVKQNYKFKTLLLLVLCPNKIVQVLIYPNYLLLLPGNHCFLRPLTAGFLTLTMSETIKQRASDLR